MNRITIRRFDVVRTANVVAALYMAIVLIFGLLFFVPFALFGGIAASRVGGSGAAIFGAGLVGSLIFVAIGVVVYGVIGWIMTAIMVALYNFVAGRVGGIRMVVDLEVPYGAPGYGGPGYPAGYGGGGYGTPQWPAPGSPGAPGGGAPTQPPGWGQPPR
jgi:hypothetical protein